MWSQPTGGIRPRHVSGEHPLVTQHNGGQADISWMLHPRRAGETPSLADIAMAVGVCCKPIIGMGGEGGSGIVLECDGRNGPNGT